MGIRVFRNGVECAFIPFRMTEIAYRFAHRRAKSRKCQTKKTKTNFDSPDSRLFPDPRATSLALIPPNPSRSCEPLRHSSVSRRVFFGSRFASAIYDPACASPGIPARTSHPQVTPDFAMAAVTMSMAAVTPALVGANKSAFKGTRVSAVAPKKVSGGRATLQVRTPAMRPPAPSPSGRRQQRHYRANARASPRASRSERARVSGVVGASTPRARGGTGSRDWSTKNASHRTDPGSSACRVRRGYAPGSPRVRAEATAGSRRRTPRRAPRSSRRARRASDARPLARDPAHVRAKRAVAPRPALYPLAAVWDAVALGPDAPNPGFLSHGRRKSEKTFRDFRVCFFFACLAPI